MQGEEKLFSAADEMHDLQLIAVRKLCLCPQFPADNLAVQLHRHAVVLHAKLLKKGCQRHRSIEFLLLSIDI